MQSKTSYFSKTIFLKNITHYWPIWAAYLLVCLVRLPLRIYTNLNAQVTDVTDMEAFRVTLLQDTIDTALQPFTFFLFACITAIAVFSYLYQARSANMIHALPLCRESLFITNILSGISFLVIPQIIAFLTGIFVCFLQQMTQLEYLLHWLILSSGMVIFAFALAVFAVMITGNIIAAPVFFIIMNYLFVGCKTLLSSFIETLSFGVTNASFTFGDFLSPYYFLTHHFNGYYTLFTGDFSDFSLTEAYTYIGGYFAASIPIFIIAFLLYKKKHLETAGDFLAVSFLKPLFRWGATICLGSGIAILGQSFFNFDDRSGNNFVVILLLLATVSITVFFLSEMLIQKNFRVFSIRKFAECGMATVLLLALVTGIECNVFGIETKVPKEEDIATIYFSSTYTIDVNDTDFAKVISIHQALVDAKQETEAYFKRYSKTATSTCVGLTYTLKNGKTLSRRYWVPVEEAYLEDEDYVLNQIEELSHNPTYYLEHHFTDAYNSVTFVEGSLEVYTDSQEFDNILLNQAQCIQIYEAFQKDVQEGNYRIYDSSVYDNVKDLVYYNNLSFSYNVPQDNTYISYSDTKTVQETAALQWTDIALTTSCVHTLQALEEMGILNEQQQMITQSEADKIFNEEFYEDTKVYY